jgi:hypothetical protein
MGWCESASKRFGSKVLQENHPYGPGFIFSKILIFFAASEIRGGKYLRPRGWTICLSHLRRILVPGSERGNRSQFFDLVIRIQGRVI